MTVKRVGLMLIVLGLIAGGQWVTVPARAQTPDVWPTDGWRASSPEAQGMDSEQLAGVLRTIAETDININSVIVVRNGYVVLDAPIHPFEAGDPHIIHSATKSFVSALIGIAIEEGYLAGVDQSIVEFFPGKTLAYQDPFKEEMTLEDVLMMATGLDCRDSYLYDWEGMSALWASEDWVAHILSLPMREEPGTRFEYCNSASFLLAAIIQEVTGLTALDYARDRLFDPLGFGPVEWRANPHGITLGWGEMRIAPADAAKFGYLYLRKGMWDGAQIVPAEWVAASTTPRIAAGTLGEDYGYQWWIESEQVYAAEGYAGQYIFVVPDLDIVAVFVSGLPGEQFEVPQELLEDIIIPAAISNEALPENPAALAELRSMIETLANPTPQPVSALPEIAQAISGVTYDLNPNPMAVETFTLAFEESADVAQFHLANQQAEQTFDVGLDGRFRIAETLVGERVALRGEWVGDRFVMITKTMSDPEHRQFDITFEKDSVLIAVSSQVTGDTWEMSGQRR